MNHITERLVNFTNRVRCLPDDDRIRHVDSSDAPPLDEVVEYIKSLEKRLEGIDTVMFLRDLANRIMNIPTKHGTDGSDSEKLYNLARELEKGRKS